MLRLAFGFDEGQLIARLFFLKKGFSVFVPDMESLFFLLRSETSFVNILRDIVILSKLKGSLSFSPSL